MTGTLRQQAQKALSLARFIKEMKAAYLTAFVCFSCVGIGYVAGFYSATSAAKAGIYQYKTFTNALILRRFG